MIHSESPDRVRPRRPQRLSALVSLLFLGALLLPGAGSGTPWNVLTGPTIVQGQWAHLVGTCDTATGNTAFFVNGQLDSGFSNIVSYKNIVTSCF